MKPILQEHDKHGEHHNFLQEMQLHNAESHFSYIRMSKKMFDFILTKVCITLYMHACVHDHACSPVTSQVGPLLRKRSYLNKLRPQVPPAEKLALTLRYLATGNS